MTDALDRIAAALERLAPVPPMPTNPLAHPAHAWEAGRLRAILFDPLPLARLVGVERQRDLLVENLGRLARGHAAHDVLLWGARGSGKSALALGAVAAVQRDQPALGLVVARELADLPALFAALRDVARPFALFLDDAGVEEPGAARALRSLLEGGAEPRPGNVRLLVTANRRHLAPRSGGEEVSARDALDDELALADRFGLSLGFHPLDQDTYLAAVAAHAGALGLDVDPAEALAWARGRSGRSGRVAWQFVVEVAGRAGRGV